MLLHQCIEYPSSYFIIYKDHTVAYTILRALQNEIECGSAAKFAPGFSHNWVELFPNGMHMYNQYQGFGHNAETMSNPFKKLQIQLHFIAKM